MKPRFLRGLHYFNLVRCFGAVPLRTNPIDSGTSEGLEKSPIPIIYNQVIADLEFAAQNCWQRQETRNNEINDLGRATSAAANGLLAKVYLRIASCIRTAINGTAGNASFLDF